MLDFFARGSKGKQDPLANSSSAKAYAEKLKQEFGAGAHDKVAELLDGLSSPSLELSADQLEAVLTLNQETQPLHDALCVQYLMNSRMPKVLETQLRAQILNYGKHFTDFYQYALPITADNPNGVKVQAHLPLVLARMFHYLAEYAKWQYIRNYQPDEVFWLNVNQLYRFAEQRGWDSHPVFLFGEKSAATTVQDLYLALQMMSVLSNGNLNARQVNFSYELLALLSNRMTISKSHFADASFYVSLVDPKPASRAKGEVGSESARYWSTAELVEILHGWAVVMEAGRIPPELKRLIEPGIDASLLRVLTREWAAKPVLFERAERVAVSNRQVEVAHRLHLLHKLIRKPDEEQMQSQRGVDKDSYEDAANIRIYGFVTSRKRDKTSSPLPATSSLSLSGETAEAALPQEFQKWSLENVSQTGLGVTLDVMGNEWVGLGSLIGFREPEQEGWSLGIIRRVKRTSRERIYLGVETLSTRPLAASLRPTDARLIDPTLPPDQVWLAGHISLFMPYRKAGKLINALILPLSLYMLGKQFYMTARGKHFQIALGKVMEKGSDWCMAEVELVKTLDKLPVAM
ncbi:hypothetical protein VL04_04750 [Chromobacterium violaceum]|uniref:hypothetical protein n=1 Tax=Chromobacterium violaceum TaxID=536 RepID=UPI0006547BA6|nr:hypothetical protein [Chromobacterium violaceum]KMN48394.1 hypothetical protein VK93_15600 [Chromobacterium violaceum]KMN85704.1 hypothetical protein VL02_14020 [Chromobacterium violaceum]KMN91609.1 hypothetical protein VL04_04750 [Chromobacterium violaceum]KMO05793.1 hypothetical protein VL16_01465 [Chromobacterium violaceum]